MAIDQRPRNLRVPVVADAALIVDQAPGEMDVDLRLPQRSNIPDLLAFARTAATTVFHPTSTCRKGSDATAVVDERLRVRGIGHLGVVDASIMPTVSSGNTNAAVVMIGEKGADMILQDTAAP